MSWWLVSTSIRGLSYTHASLPAAAVRQNLRGVIVCMLNACRTVRAQHTSADSSQVDVCQLDSQMPMQNAFLKVNDHSSRNSNLDRQGAESDLISSRNNDSSVLMAKCDAIVKCNASASVWVHVTATYT